MAFRRADDPERATLAGVCSDDWHSGAILDGRPAGPAVTGLDPGPHAIGAHTGRRAVVIGAGIAGLLAARVLSDHFEAVTVVERDRLPKAEPSPRPGAPQAGHVHGLLARGHAILERLFPGLDTELAAAGAPLLDWTQDCWWFTFGGWKPRFPSGILTRTVSRDRLEWTIRRRVEAAARVQVLEQREVHALLPAPGGAGVAGVLLRERGGTDGATRELGADLVVDASGRGSRAPDWLAALGYPRPSETTVNAFLGYASRWYAPPPGWTADWQVLAMLATPPAGKRGGIIQTVEGGRWVVTLAGAARDYPPTDEGGFRTFARSLPSPELYQAIQQAEPISPIRGYRRTENRLRHYERLRRWPAGFLVLGDAVCSLNPVYAQGMTVAALGALVLDRSLRRPRMTGSRLARRFQRDLARAQTTPWLLATGEDFRHPTTEGRRPTPASHLMHRYIDRLQLVATDSPAVHRALIEVLNLLRPPVGLLAPRLVLQALIARRRGLNVSTIHRSACEER
jgi:2-polyprenyl-6-methoxyphenol hydroxylase-like FAD-dependent oxidoreductase